MQAGPFLSSLEIFYHVYNFAVLSPTTLLESKPQEASDLNICKTGEKGDAIQAPQKNSKFILWRAQRNGLYLNSVPYV